MPFTMNKPQTSVRLRLVKGLTALAAAAALTGYLYWYTGNRENPSDSVRQTENSSAGEQDKFYTEQITPILHANTSANTKALEALERDIHSQFARYRKRVPAFTADITGIGNKSKITWEALKQMASDDKEKVKRHVTGKFEMHVVSAVKMEKDIERILRAFRMDVEANRNRMLVEIEAAIKNDPRFSVSEVKMDETFRKMIEAGISDVSVQAGKDAVVLSGMTFLVAFATEEAVRHLVVAALTRVGSSLAASMGTAAAASGGATVAGAATGGGSGSLGGPAGAAIGLAAGITVGVIVDHLMTVRMETTLNEECNAFLTKVEKELVTAPNGLVPNMRKALAEIEWVEASVIKQQILSLP